MYPSTSVEFIGLLADTRNVVDPILKLQLLNEKTISQLLLIPSQNLKSHLYFVSRCIALQTYTYIPVLHVTFCIVDDEALINTIYPI